MTERTAPSQALAKVDSNACRSALPNKSAASCLVSTRGAWSQTSAPLPYGLQLIIIVGYNDKYLFSNHLH